MFSLSVLDVFDRFQIFVLFGRVGETKQISPELKCLTVLVVCERVLNDLKRFDTNLVNKYFKNTFFLVLGHENHF